jgi:hypothetical protein
LFFKERIVAKETMEANGDVDPTLPMLEVVENFLQSTSTPPSTSARPIRNNT